MKVEIIDPRVTRGPGWFTPSNLSSCLGMLISTFSPTEVKVAWRRALPLAIGAARRQGFEKNEMETGEDAIPFPSPFKIVPYSRTLSFLSVSAPMRNPVCAVTMAFSFQVPAKFHDSVSQEVVTCSYLTSSQIFNLRSKRTDSTPYIQLNIICSLISRVVLKHIPLLHAPGRPLLTSRLARS